jgi:hypothetical protein
MPRTDVPLTLMRMALALLDRHGRDPAIACHLQAAIDTATGARPMQRGEQIDDESVGPCPNVPIYQ